MRVISAPAVLFNELTGGWSTRMPSFPGGIVTVRKYKPIACSDTVRQHLHFISGSECVYLQFHHTVAPSKLESNIAAAVSFCCFWEISSKEALCRDGVYHNFILKPDGTELFRMGCSSWWQRIQKIKNKIRNHIGQIRSLTTWLHHPVRCYCHSQYWTQRMID